MSNTLNSAQIATFDRFAEDVHEFLTNNSTKLGSTYHVDKKAFGKVWDAAGRPSNLRAVMNNVTSFEKTGRTKVQFQKRTPDGTLCFRPDGSPIMSPRFCVMYTVEAYRAMRAEVTGLKTPEPFFMVNWDEVPGDIQYKLATKFPKKTEGAPEFTPKQVGLLLRKGKKPTKKGEKRHNWAAFDFLVVGSYGKYDAVITQAYVINRPYLERLAEAIDAECPDWGQTQPQEVKEDLSKAASGLMAAAIDLTDVDDLL